MAAVYALLHWRQARQLNWLLLSGVMAGLAMGFKYTSFITPLFLAGVVVWDYRRNWRAAMRSLALLTLSATLAGAPMYVRNWILVGNPVYPFLHDWFNGRYWDSYRAISYAETGTGIGFDLLAILRLPYDMTLGYKDVTQDVQLGPLMLVFLPLLLLYGLSRWRRRTPPAFAILLLSPWFNTVSGLWALFSTKGLWQSRLLLSGLVVLPPLMAWVWEDLARWDHPQFSLRRFLKLALAVVLALNLISQVSDWLRAPPGRISSAQRAGKRRCGARWGRITRRWKRSTNCRRMSSSPFCMSRAATTASATAGRIASWMSWAIGAICTATSTISPLPGRSKASPTFCCINSAMNLWLRKRRQKRRCCGNYKPITSGPSPTWSALIFCTKYALKGHWSVAASMLCFQRRPEVKT